MNHRYTKEVPLKQEYRSSTEFDELSLADQKYLALKRSLMSPGVLKLQHGDIEEKVKTEGFEVLRGLMQEHFDRRAEQEPELEHVTGADGVERTHCRDGCETPLETLFGAVVVTRKGYSARGASSLFPLEGEANLPVDKYSHGLKKQVVHEVTGRSFDGSVAAIDRTTGGHVPKRQVENIAVEVAQHFDEFYNGRAAKSQEKTDDLLIMTTDAKGIRMRKEALREATRKAAAKKEKHKARLSKGEKSNSKRMAQVGAVYTVGKHVRRPQDIMRTKDEKVVDLRPKTRNKRVLASVARDPGNVINDLFEEAKHRDPEMKRDWCMLVDGSKSQLDSVQSCIRLHRAAHTIVILDFVHVLEYLWKASYCFHSEGSKEAAAWVNERALLILQGKSSSVAAGMRRSATMRGLKKGKKGSKRKSVDTCADYLLKYAEFLRYDEYLSKGYPIATGVIEGACRHLVKDRMDITGARWGLSRAEAVLKLRSLDSSGDLAEYFEFYKAKSQVKNHASRYQNIPWRESA